MHDSLLKAKNLKAMRKEDVERYHVNTFARCNHQARKLGSDQR